MASRPVLQTIVYTPFDGGPRTPLPPPPPRDTIHSSPLRRQHALLPPVLSTTIPIAHGGSNYSTPLSSISHRSPFSAVPSSPAVLSARTPVSGPAMSSRMSGHFNVQYDPRDWAPGNDARAAQAQRAIDNAAEDGLASPPPPYSPEGARSPREGLTRSQTVAASQTLPQNPGYFAQRRINPVSNAPSSHRHSIHLGTYSLPPPPSATVLPVPRARVVSQIQPIDDSPVASVDHDQQPPATRRAASASAELSRVGEASSSRSSSQQRIWVSGMPLPGPPPGPPPPTSRSQSTSGVIDRQIPHHPRPIRQTIHVSDLSPVPPTPITWDGQLLPVVSPASLHVNTTSLQNSPYTSPINNKIADGSLQREPIVQPDQQQLEPSSSIIAATPTLSRSSAVRDSSAKGLRERRASNRNSRIFDSDLNSISIQTNPWADALQEDTSLLSSGPRSARLPPKSPSPLALVMSSNDRVSASPVQMTSTPPVSPSPGARNLFNGPRSAGLPPKALPTPPLSQKPPLSAQSVTQPRKEISVIVGDTQSIFDRDARQRHDDFLQKENSAISDIERLNAFAEYILMEASIRQKRYESTFLSGKFDVEQLRCNLFKAPIAGRSASNSFSQVSVDERDVTTGNTTPQTRPDTTWWKDYQPALSPIASLDYDEMSSRGRAPSRWWESQTGSHSGDTGGRTVRRSKRESKYMGLSKEFLMAYSPSEEYPNVLGPSEAVPDPSSYPVEKANPETFGYFETEIPRQSPENLGKKPQTPTLLDISRFITLPPPYPRHYPAVNNNHPDLSEYRTTVRTLGELEEVKTRTAKHNNTIDNLRSVHRRKLSDSRRNLKASIQAQIDDGSITYKQAGDAEDAFKMTEFQAEKQQLQSEFDLLQDAVINPLHDMLHGRIAQLDTSIQKLSDDLHIDARYQDPDQPQEAGDEKPELLEKLTQLKWLFDVREQIHRECFDLLSERNDKFKGIVLLPYQFSRNTEKVNGTEKFFEKDGQTRFIAFCGESLKRHNTFLETIEQHVRRGVELQSSAFWDIAPGLLDLLHKIPEDLRHSDGIQIPDKEYNENPSYRRHPEQYLYLLLSHAQKSTYQFIEGQVNLQCLQHEVKNSSLSARYRLLEAEGGRDVSEQKTEEEAALTAELKQKASMIEEQWFEALGSQMQTTRDRVRTLLQEDHAWDEVAEEDT